MTKIYKYIIISILLSGFGYAEFSKNSNGVVTDSITKLQWDDSVNPYDTQKELSIVDATVTCEDLSLDGHDDWRLPNINELSSLIDDTRYNPATYSIFTNYSNNENDNFSYWSSTTNGRTTDRAWIVKFQTGENNYYAAIKASDKYYVRCVRSL